MQEPAGKPGAGAEGMNQVKMLDGVNAETKPQNTADRTSPYINPDMVVAEAEPVRAAPGDPCRHVTKLAPWCTVPAMQPQPPLMVCVRRCAVVSIVDLRAPVVVVDASVVGSDAASLVERGGKGRPV